MFYFKPLFRWWGSLYEALRGPRVLKDITEPRTHIESLVGYSISGYVTTIHCQERKYLCVYDRWFVRNRTLYSYCVFASVTGSAPQVIVDACMLEKSFPKLLHEWAPTLQQKEAAIGAYLDVLLERLQQHGRELTNSFVR